jgi:hypothetical protein
MNDIKIRAEIFLGNEPLGSATVIRDQKKLERNIKK